MSLPDGRSGTVGKQQIELRYAGPAGLGRNLRDPGGRAQANCVYLTLVMLSGSMGGDPVIPGKGDRTRLAWCAFSQAATGSPVIANP